ncbi:MAG: porin [Afipia sp.]|nr:porin [Afipia sp.]
MHQALVYILRPIAVAALSIALTCAASAQQSDPKVKRQRSYTTPSQQTVKPQPVARPRSSAACSEFGAGFVRMPGSDSCIRVGGSIGAGVGMSR